MKFYLLDTSALMALRDNEAGADRVAELLAAHEAGRAKVFACFFSEFEVLYRVWKDEGEAVGRLAHAQCKALPMEWVAFSEPLMLEAAAIKAGARLSVADAWIAASARLAGAALVHKDPEFQLLDLVQEPLPMRG